MLDVRQLVSNHAGELFFIQEAQDALGRRIAVENPSHYVRIEGHEWDEIDFLAELATRTGCGLLLDVNNVHVGAHNLGYDATAYIDAFPGGFVDEIHLAGKTSVQIRYSVDAGVRPNGTETTTITGHGPGLPDAIENLHDALRNYYDVRTR